MDGGRKRLLAVFELGVVCPTAILLAWGLYRHPQQARPGFLLWIAVVMVADLLPVPAWRGVQVSVSFPVLVAVAFLYEPLSAAAVAFIATTDPRELKREVSLLRALFNRAQIAVAVYSAGLVFHALTSLDGPVPLVLAAAAAAVSADYLVNIAMVSTAGSILWAMSPWQVMRKVKVGNPLEFLVSYLGLGALGIVLAQLYLKVGFWSVVVFVVPLILARQMFFRSKALEDAHKELEDREVILRQLSNRMAEERQDERVQIAGFLHDDLAQLLFRMSLQVDLASRHLDAGEMDEVKHVLDEVKETKNRTSDKIRSLIRDLHRSPLGRTGLAEALHSFTTDVASGASVTFRLDVEDLPLPPPIQLLAYHIAREAIMNSLKYAEATRITVSFVQEDDAIKLEIQDDGLGFDADADEPEGHYGLTMMRERAQIAGGSFDLVSAKGKGAIITVRFPLTWLQAGGADPGTSRQKAAATAEVEEEPDLAAERLPVANEPTTA